MDNSLFSKNRARLEGLLAEATSIGVVVGPEHQDLDKMAASLSLYLSLVRSHKKANVQIVSKKDPIVGISNLVGIDKVKKTFDGKATALTIAIPYKEGEIEKVSYKIEGNKLNINLFAMQDSGISFKEDEIQYIKKGAMPDLLFAVGVESEAELKESIGEVEVPVIAINKRNINASYAQLTYTDGSFSSNSEIVAEIIQDLGLTMDVDIAQNILDGIMYATRNFSAPQTSPFAFASTAFALEQGAKRKEVKRESEQVSQRDRETKNSIQELPVLPVQKKEEPTQVPEQPEQKEVIPEKLEEEEQPRKEEAQTAPREDSSRKVPRDWFVPKVYKGAKDLEE
jgi:hypothetical protein